MSSQPGHIEGDFEADAGSNNNRIDDTTLLSPEDSELFTVVSGYMKGCFDLEDVRNDHDLPGLEDDVREMIKDHYSKDRRDNPNESFIRDALKSTGSNDSLDEEIRSIRQETEENKLDEITAEWVKEWHEKKHKTKGRDARSEEIRDFVISSFKDESIEPETGLSSERKRIPGSTLRKYTSVSAAAIITLFIIFRTLLPPYNPEKLFNTYYEPMSILSPVTRNSDPDMNGNYIQAIEKYRLGDYQGAVTGFSDAMESDNSAIEPQFFMGLTELELGNFGPAANLLTGVTNSYSGYSKDAQWYLGLIYLKTGEEEKALTCFKLLTQSQSSYRERAEKIVRRLK